MMEVWSAGNVTSNTDLIGARIPRVACDFERLASSQPFLQHVGVDHLQLLLQSPWICDGNETVKFKALCTWLRVSTVNTELIKRERHFKHLLELINMNRLSKEFVIEASLGGLDFNLSENARCCLISMTEYVFI
ncbi:unnamed protein product [Rodentolepis nana]|uniref:BACK domain-containing protein n=1 Tax=Rodentolepis nana TaxID=102285 RepID=A0A3P7S267_RODNA|nr:unnamed protein product [Rodentolepis nana]